MEAEQRLAGYVATTRFEDIPREPVDIAKRVILTIMGTTVAGSTAEGCEEIADLIRKWGGSEEAMVLVHGYRVPAHNAVFMNSIMARALDICDSMRPGMHVGSSSVPTALAAAELAGGCSGREFLSALVLGTELAARINGSSDYDGFDPTGICSIFASTAVAGRVLRLNTTQMLNGLALAFNKAGGSFQSNIDGSLAVRVIQGFVSQGGMICAELAESGITGPKNFLEGVYGYFHLYAKDQFNKEAVLGGLGTRYEMNKTLFKSHPSCGATLASTDAILYIMKESGLTPEDVSEIHVRVSPYIYRLAGHRFEIGDNPRVNGQFSIQYCVANALLRGIPRLQHFEESHVRDPRIMGIIEKIHVASFPGADGADSPLAKTIAAEMKVTTVRGDVIHKKVDVPRGYPGNPLTELEHQERFHQYLSYGSRPLPKKNMDKLVSLVNGLEEVDDVRTLIPLLVSE